MTTQFGAQLRRCLVSSSEQGENDFAVFGMTLHGCILTNAVNPIALEWSPVLSLEGRCARFSPAMNNLDTRVADFFAAYQRANADFDVPAIAACYADVFLFGDPQGTRSVNKQDFVNVLPRRKDYFRSLGLSGSRLASLNASELDSRYTLVKTVWIMRFEPAGKQPIESRNSSTYVLLATGDSFQIVFQIDHQNLAERVRDLGLAG
ncbi:MAG TPA: hypothetical protein VMU28_16325 [Terriglobales bacterium]|nr:hypothetical protein [Terriglobales bacterium]